MHINLDLLNGSMAREDVEKALGHPDDMGVTRRRSNPTIYLYGDVELWFCHGKLAAAFDAKSHRTLREYLLPDSTSAPS